MAKRRKTNSNSAKAQAKPETTRKTTNTKTTRRKSLQNIKEMPLDVLFEIFGCLEPFDLLRLSRTNKDLRNILMSKSSISVWKAARNKTELPDPAPYMSEPAFAHLVFDRHCHFCLTTVVHTIFWDVLTRCCRSCSRTEIQDRDEIEELFDDRTDYSDKLWKIFPRIVKANGTLYIKSVVMTYIQKYESLSSNQRRLWLEKELEMTEALRKSNFLETCKSWERYLSYARQDELLAAKQVRFKAIIAKLQESGWEKELDWEDASGRTVREKLRRHKLVNQPKPLTDRIWKNIAPGLEEFPSPLRDELLQVRRQSTNITRFRVLFSILDERERDLPRDIVIPPLLYLLMTEPFLAIFEGLPIEAGWETSIFDDALLKLPSIIQEWNDTRTQIVLNVLQSGCPTSTKDDLFLASSLFRCTNPRCNSRAVYSYPAILLHSCTFSTVPNPSWLSDVLVTECQRESSFGWEWYYSDPDSFMVELHSTAVAASRAVCQISGLDLSATTMDEILKLNPLVECQTCTTTKGSRLFMRWTAAVKHIHSDGFRVVTKEDMEIGLEKVFDHEWKSKTEYRCKHCTFKTNRYKHPIREHLASSHGITNIQKDDWEFYLRTISISGIRSSPVWISHLGCRRLSWRRGRCMYGFRDILGSYS